MQEVVKTIKKIAGFADVRNEGFNQSWNDIYFHKHECFAQTEKGGALAPVDLEFEGGVNAVALAKALKAIKSDPEFSLDNKSKEFVIKCGQTKIKLPVSPISNSPNFNRPPKKMKWFPDFLLQSLKRIVWCVSSDFTRPHLSGVWFGSLGLEASNGHAFVAVNGINYREVFGDNFSVYPSLLKDINAECFLAIEDNRLFISDNKKGSSFRAAKLIGANRPAFDSVLESAGRQPRATINRMQLLDVIKRASISNTKMLFQVKGNRLSIGTDQVYESLFSFSDSVILEDNEGIPEGKIGLDARHLKPLLENATSANISIRITPTDSGGVNPLMLEDGAYIGLVMPWRL